MRRVVITGLGVVSCLGNNQEEVHQSLLKTKSGISFSEEYKEHNLKSHVHGKPNIKLEDHIDRKTIRFMGSGSAYNYIAMKEAIEDSGLEDSEVSNFKTGIVMGSGGPSIENVILAADKTRAKTPKLMGPFIVPRTMASTASATLAVPFKIKGTNYTMSSACATSGHCIGNSMELIQMGKQDVVFAGGSEEIHWAMTAMFDAMTALSSKYNDTPEKASRAYDKTRDGFVIAGGAGVLVLEEYEHAKARGAKIYAELTGYGATSDGYDMVAPSGEGAVRCMQMAMAASKNKTLLLCTCGSTMELKPKDLARAVEASDVKTTNLLCTENTDIAVNALKGDEEVIIACEQQSHFFNMLSEEVGVKNSEETKLITVDIRDRAGWTSEKSATAKQAALLSELTLEKPMTLVKDIISKGVCLILGHDEAALDLAEKLCETLAVTVILSKPLDLYAIPKDPKINFLFFSLEMF